VHERPGREDVSWPAGGTPSGSRTSPYPTDEKEHTMKTPLGIAACALVALGGGGLAVAEVSGAFGDGAVDEHVVRAPVHEVVIDAEDGEVTLVRSADDVHVRVRRSHLINTPSTSYDVAGGVLTLKTRCPIGFVTCRSDYRVGVPAGVAVRVDKPSGRVDATGVGGGVTVLHDGDRALTLTAR
jgi:hypothetical protein